MRFGASILHYGVQFITIEIDQYTWCLLHDNHKNNQVSFCSDVSEITYQSLCLSLIALTFLIQCRLVPTIVLSINESSTLLLTEIATLLVYCFQRNANFIDRVAQDFQVVNSFLLALDFTSFGKFKKLIHFYSLFRLFSSLWLSASFASSQFSFQMKFQRTKKKNVGPKWWPLWNGWHAVRLVFRR